MKKEKYVLIAPTFLANTILRKAQEKNISINCVKLYIFSDITPIFLIFGFRNL